MDEKGEGGMETREAILDFQYSEKMKSGLIIGTTLLDQLVSLKGDEEALRGSKGIGMVLRGIAPGDSNRRECFGIRALC